MVGREGGEEAQSGDGIPQMTRRFRPRLQAPRAPSEAWPPARGDVRTFQLVAPREVGGQSVCFTLESANP